MTLARVQQVMRSLVVVMFIGETVRLSHLLLSSGLFVSDWLDLIWRDNGIDRASVVVLLAVCLLFA